jgi:hypothetical protein
VHTVRVLLQGATSKYVHLYHCLLSLYFFKTFENFVSSFCFVRLTAPRNSQSLQSRLFHTGTTTFLCNLHIFLCCFHLCVTEKFVLRYLLTGTSHNVFSLNSDEEWRGLCTRVVLLLPAVGRTYVGWPRFFKFAEGVKGSGFRSFWTYGVPMCIRTIGLPLSFTYLNESSITYV